METKQDRTASLLQIAKDAMDLACAEPDADTAFLMRTLGQGVLQLMADVEALKRDAELYAWLRATGRYLIPVRTPDYFHGWVVSSHNAMQSPFPLMDDAVLDAWFKEKNDVGI